MTKIFQILFKSKRFSKKCPKSPHQSSENLLSPNYLKCYDNPSFDAISSTPPPCLLDLEVDCFEELFQYLSIKDLKSLRLTCRYLKVSIDDYIKKSYPAIKFGYRKFRIFHHRDVETLKRLKSDYKMIRELEILDYKTPLKPIRSLLNQVESVTLYPAVSSSQPLIEILQLCDQLKSLRISGRPTPANDWILQKLPQFEHIEYRLVDVVIGKIGRKVMASTITTFATDDCFLRKNYTWLMAADIKTECLEVNICPTADDKICNALNLLFKRKIYKKLHLYIHCLDEQSSLDRLILVNGLEKLHICNVNNVFIKGLIKVNDVFVPNLMVFRDFQNGMNYRNLRSICAESADLKGILTIVRHFPKVKHLKINSLEGCADGFIRKIRHLNEERERRLEACEMTIYFPEELFLYIKWKSMVINTGLVVIERNQAIEMSSNGHECTRVVGQT